MKEVKNKIRVAVLFGGQSAEHEVSIQSARNVVDALDPNRYEISLIGIDKGGRWHPFTTAQLLSANSLFLESGRKNTAVASLDLNSGHLLRSTGDATTKIDVVFPVLHGPMGEDGTVQGLLQLARIPFVGSGVLGSAVSMDKDVMKRLIRDAGLPTAKFLTFRDNERKEIKFTEIKKKLGLPVFIKPANLGSSVGITKVHSQKEFSAALDLAFTFDTKIIIEEYIKGREIECSVLGNEKPRASVCGEIVPHHEFYSYEAKYLDKNGAELLIPARLTKQLEKKVQELAVKTFEILNCAGLARVDFFVAGDMVYVNEINTIPGFTAISMYPKLWEKSGLSYKKLIDTLIDLALERFQKEKRFLSATSSNRT